MSVRSSLRLVQPESAACGRWHVACVAAVHCRWRNQKVKLPFMSPSFVEGKQIDQKKSIRSCPQQENATIFRLKTNLSLPTGGATCERLPQMMSCPPILHQSCSGSIIMQKTPSCILTVCNCYPQRIIRIVITDGSYRDRDSRVGTASHWKARRNTHAGSNLRCGEDFSPKVRFQCRRCYGVCPAPVCSRVHQHLCARSKSQTLAATALVGHRKTPHALIGRTVTLLLRLLYLHPGKATRLYHDWRTMKFVCFFK